MVAGASLPCDDAPVLVGIDGGAAGWEALEWAAAEAAARQAELEVRHTVSLRLCFDPVGVVPMDPPVDVEAAARVLATAAERARAVEPSLAVSIVLRRGCALDALDEPPGVPRSLVVLGRSEARWLDLVTGSVGELLSQRKSAPVAIIRLGRAPVTGPSAGRVVLAVEDADSGLSAALFALRSAHRRGVGLTVVGVVPARQERTFADLFDLSVTSPPELGTTACRFGAGNTTFEVVRRLSRLFPDVDVRRRTGRGSLSHVLVEESRGAALTVVGTQRRGFLGRVFGGGAARRLLRTMPAPIVLVGAPPVR